MGVAQDHSLVATSGSEHVEDGLIIEYGWINVSDECLEHCFLNCIDSIVSTCERVREFSSNDRAELKISQLVPVECSPAPSAVGFSGSFNFRKVENRLRNVWLFSAMKQAPPNGTPPGRWCACSQSNRSF